MRAKTGFRTSLLAVAIAMGCAVSAWAQSYPARPIRIIVPYPAGGVLDMLTRAISEHARVALGQPWIIENRMGASGALGLQACATAEPDGYTFCPVTAEALSVTPHFDPKLAERYKSLVPVTQFVSADGVIYAHPSLKANSLREVVDYARAHPTELSYSSWGAGTSPHLLFEWVKKTNNIEILHVPHRGSAEAVNEVIAGRLPLSYVAVGFVMPQIRAGNLKPLAVIGNERSAMLPDTPALGELGIPFPYKGAWFGMMAPDGTPIELRERIAAVVKEALNKPELRARFLDPQGYKAVGSRPDEFAAHIRTEFESGAEIMRLTGIKAP
jgi:tripartite-type tricarboxylate transporter receptor subunit TctC